MIAKPVVLGLLAAACVTAAAGGAYVAVRHNDEPSQGVPAASAPNAPVAETEAVVTPPASPSSTAEPSAAATVPLSKPQPAVREELERPQQRSSRPTPPAAPQRSTATSSANGTPSSPRPAPSRSAETAPADPSLSERSSPPREPAGIPAAVPTLPPATDVARPEPPPPPRPQFVEVQVPESSVVGLRVTTSLSSETARVEDRVEAQVTRDVMADGQLAIPEGSRVLGDVITVERGGKMKDKARLGVRFHTLVLADGRHVPFRTDAIFRDGSSPGAESARKIGGAAIGGAVLGAIIGGAKGAAIGGATGAAGGSAVVMAGDRNPATLPAGTVVTVRLASPVTISVEKES